MVNLYYITVLLIYQRVNIIASINLTAIRYGHIKHSSSKSCSQCRIDVDFHAVKRLAFYTRLTVLYTMNSTIPDKREIQPWSPAYQAQEAFPNCRTAKQESDIWSLCCSHDGTVYWKKLNTDNGIISLVALKEGNLLIDPFIWSAWRFIFILSRPLSKKFTVWHVMMPN